MDLIGRKKLLIAANFLSLVGWIVIVCSTSVIVVCVGRFLGGVAVAAIIVTGKQGFNLNNNFCMKPFLNKIF
jgi:MFS family permease